jgi:hypothetical protein
MINTLLIAYAALLAMFVVRNNRTIAIRMAILDTHGLDAHQKLPSYDAMVFHPKHWHRWTMWQWMEWTE